MSSRRLRLRWAVTCSVCERTLPPGTIAVWSTEAKAASCLTCSEPGGTVEPTTIAPTRAPAGVAGASARRQYEHRAGRERRRQERAVADDAAWREQVVEAHPVLGRIATLVTAKPAVGPPSQRTQAWADGAAGEELLARHLAGLPETVVVLHDRRIPNTLANIDHIAIAPSGVYVIDAKNYAGRVEVRDVGPWLRSEQRLYVNGRDRTRLLDGVHRQLHIVKGLLPDDVPVRGVLCFVGENWRVLFRRPLTIGDVAVLWRSRLVEQLSASGPLLPRQVGVIAEKLSVELPTA